MPWRSFEAVEFATLEWVDWFYNRRVAAEAGTGFRHLLDRASAGASA